MTTEGSPMPDLPVAPGEPLSAEEEQHLRAAMSNSNIHVWDTGMAVLMVSRLLVTLDALRSQRDMEPLREPLDVDRLARAMSNHYGKSAPMRTAASFIADEYAALGEEPHGQ